MQGLEKGILGGRNNIHIGMEVTKRKSMDNMENRSPRQTRK